MLKIKLFGGNNEQVENDVNTFLADYKMGKNGIFSITQSESFTQIGQTKDSVRFITISIVYHD